MAKVKIKTKQSSQNEDEVLLDEPEDSQESDEPSSSERRSKRPSYAPFSVEPGDYLIFLDKKNRKHLAQVVKKPNQGLVEVEIYKNGDVVGDDEISLLTVQAVLGPNPLPGRAYGVNVKYPVMVTKTLHWGQTIWYTKYPSEAVDFFSSAMAEVGSKLKKKGVFPSKQVDIFVENPKEVKEGKTATLAKYGHFKKEDKPDVMFFFCPVDADKDLIQYIAYHEAGHSLWFLSLTDEDRTKWMKAAKDQFSVKNISEEELRAAKDYILDTDHTRRDYVNKDNEEYPTLALVLRWLYEKFRYNAYHVEQLAKFQPEIFDECWPSVIDLAETIPLVTKYGATSPEELFAEATAAYFTKPEELPADITALFNETVFGMVSEVVAQKSGTNRRTPNARSASKKNPNRAKGSMRHAAYRR